MTREHLSPRLISWASILEENTRAQAVATSTLPFIYPHLALMPDAHLGKGATVGSVIPTLGAIIPAAVGVDIGCGMIAVRTQWTAEQVRGRGSLGTLRRAIEKAVPLSAGGVNRRLTTTAAARVETLEAEATAAGFDPGADAARWQLQLGSLGSGNHFIEVTVDETGAVWLFLHSGSRGVGNRIAQRHIRVAADICRRAHVELPDRDLAYLVEDSDEFWTYIRELRWAQDYALLNREEMMDRVVDAISEHMGEPVAEAERVNCHHNFTEQETHFGKQVWVSRKGAIKADVGDAGLIPGSMGTASYVVTGKGDPLSLNSSPHGAGRNHSRSAARRLFTHEQLREAMAGIEYRDTDAFIDEIPAAYKDIDQVMADAADLVEVRHVLHQIVNVKGD
ncbi:RtcB family protein [Cellulomonas xylanilytica]|uniref:3'-phosphate/5'-hydroxy nucleic acid ligase n=1 Tax=Cellulomonas xylanilytica TaxID=233583 RepID=A0A510V6I5_9CELL|nr:RtcB family protein [Cellulomonas xylanilytica]GEK22472.1 RNA-splicing ligase RtcB [Cellulomonas xylanilytica]